MNPERTVLSNDLVTAEAEAKETLRDNVCEQPNASENVFIPELVIASIAKHLPPNSIASTLRVLNKAAAAQFSDCKRINLSEQIPEHAFVRHFSASESLRSFGRLQRTQLLSLTAGSGSLVNIKQLIETTLLYLTGINLDVNSTADELWQTLQEHNRLSGRDLHALLTSSASGGHAEACRWLLAMACPRDLFEAACAAARGGHVSLLEDLRALWPHDTPATEIVRLLEAAAEGCGMADLQRLYRSEVVYRDTPLSASDKLYILAHAAASPTPDWQAKLEWLQSLGFPTSSMAACKVTASYPAADAPERLAFLRSRGVQAHADELLFAVAHGNTAALAHLLTDDPGFRSSQVSGVALTRLASDAAAGGHLAVLRLLYDRGCVVNVPHALGVAARAGHLAVVSWLAETFQLGEEALRGLSGEAVNAGSLALARWLDGRGCFQPGAWMVSEAVASGLAEEAVEWLAQRGCPVELTDRALESLVSGAHLPVLRCLHRLGWRPRGRDLERILDSAARRRHSGPTLCCLRDMGCASLQQQPTDETLRGWQVRGYSESSLRWLAEEAGIER